MRERGRGVALLRGPRAALLALGLAAGGAPLAAQLPPDLADERAEYARWLESAPTSPFAALAHLPIGSGVRLGPEGADLVLSGVPEHRAMETARGVILDGPDGPRLLARGRPVRLGPYTLVAQGPAGRGVLSVFGGPPRADPARGGAPRGPAPRYYPYDPSLAFTVRLEPPEGPRTVRLLAPDGVEVDALEAGTVTLPLATGPARLLVRWLPSTGGEESELLIYFRDGTSGKGSYPAGRFVDLLPLGGGRYRLDLNRARNPFCAYSSVYPCPAPWPGNALPLAVETGERYEAAGGEERAGGGAGPSPARQGPDRATGRAPDGGWRAALDLAGGTLRFGLVLERRTGAWRGRLCNGARCEPLSAVRVSGDSVTLEIADYAAAIRAEIRGDSLRGEYRNVGNRGPRVIPFRAARGAWPQGPAPRQLLGRWDAAYYRDGDSSPRVFEFRNGPAGFEGTIVSRTGDYGHFWGRAEADSFWLAHFDGSFVYLLTGRLEGDTLRGVFHAGLRTRTPWTAVRSTGRPHLDPPTAVTRADTTAPFRFAFPDLDGRMVTSADPRFRGKVVLVDVFGSWCPTCHDAAPTLVRLWHRYHRRGLEIVGLAYEVTGDTAVDARQVRRFRDKFRIPYPLLLAGINDTEAAAATLPQLEGFTAFPTTIFLGRDGRVRRVQAGFYGPATGAQHRRLVRELERAVEELLRERA